MNLRLYELLRMLINLVLSITTFFLVTRLIFRFFSTNPQTPFVQWIFEISNSLMVPFVNIVPNLTTQTGVLDLVAVITLIAYLVIGYILLSMMGGMVHEEIIEEDYPAVGHYHDIRPPKKVKHRKEEYDL